MMRLFISGKSVPGLSCPWGAFNISPEKQRFQPGIPLPLSFAPKSNKTRQIFDFFIFSCIINM
jgi:hypothetical protein